MSNPEGMRRLASLVLIIAGVVEIVDAIEAPDFADLPWMAASALGLALGGTWLAAGGMLVLRERLRRRRAVTLMGRIAWVSLTGYGLAETLLRTGEGSAHLVAAMIVAVAIEVSGAALEERAERDRPFGARGA